MVARDWHGDCAPNGTDDEGLHAQGQQARASHPAWHGMIRLNAAIAACSARDVFDQFQLGHISLQDDAQLCGLCDLFQRSHLRAQQEDATRFNSAILVCRKGS
eukprot:3006964-Karenia_brevis.AAC.1